jgi:hypothetical protein
LQAGSTHKPRSEDPNRFLSRKPETGSFEGLEAGESSSITQSLKAGKPSFDELSRKLPGCHREVKTRIVFFLSFPS